MAETYSILICIFKCIILLFLTFYHKLHQIFISTTTNSRKQFRQSEFFQDKHVNSMIPTPQGGKRFTPSSIETLRPSGRPMPAMPQPSGASKKG